MIALVGVWIAARQMLIADEKLRLGAFDRQYEKRFAVYEATRKILGNVYLGNISEAEIRAYALRACQKANESSLGLAAVW